jgi:Xaa-Pro dipeptidase
LSKSAIISKNSPRERRELLTSILQRRKVDAAVISDPKHVYYLTGYSTFWPRQYALLLLLKHGDSRLFLGRQRGVDARKIYDGEIVLFEEYDLSKRMVAYVGYVAEEFARFLKNSRILKGSKTVGLESWHLPQAYSAAISQVARRMKYVDITPHIMSLRKRKGSDEQASLREATKRLELAYETAKRNITIGKSEIELCHDVMSNSILKHGPFEFSRGDTWISGPRTLEVGGPPTDRKFVEGESIILDLQAVYKNYWADGARTYVVGEINEKQNELFEVILAAKKKGEELLRPGTACREVYSVVASEIEAAGYSKMFPHHAGHGLGLEDQEAPFFIPGSKERLEEGMVCTLEPGIYHPQIGGLRDEDTYVITANGYEKITTSPARLESIR